MQWISCQQCEFYEDCDCKEDRDGCYIGETKEDNCESESL